MKLNNSIKLNILGAFVFGLLMMIGFSSLILAHENTDEVIFKQAGLRAMLKKELMPLSGKEFEDLVKEFLLGNFANDLMKKAAKICMVKRVLFAKADN